MPLIDNLDAAVLFDRHQTQKDGSILHGMHLHGELILGAKIIVSLFLREIEVKRFARNAHSTRTQQIGWGA